MAIERKTVPLFGIWVWFCDDVADARKFMESYDEDPATIDDLMKARGFCARLTARDGREASLMCVFEKEEWVEIAIHEAVHAAWATLRHVQVKVKPNTDEEPLAYLTSWFGAEMIAFLAKGRGLTPDLTTE